MNIYSRIIARKIVFFLFYQAMMRLDSYDGEFDKNIPFFGLFGKDVDIMELCDYMAQQYMSYKKEGTPDYEYIRELTDIGIKYLDKIKGEVNKYISTFSFDRMDNIDKALLLLGYSEFEVLKNPKELVINEMIEIGRRYGDDGTTKLINGLLHKILERTDK